MGWDLATDADPLDDRAVPVDVRLSQVLQQPTTLTDEDQQAATAVVVVGVRLQVFGQLADALVKSAICTSGLPVSPGPVAYSAIISDLVLASSDIHIPLGRAGEPAMAAPCGLVTSR